jgi:hypothetical protein
MVVLPKRKKHGNLDFKCLNKFWFRNFSNPLKTLGF